MNYLLYKLYWIKAEQLRGTLPEGIIGELDEDDSMILYIKVPQHNIKLTEDFKRWQQEQNLFFVQPGIPYSGSGPPPLKEKKENEADTIKNV